MDLAARISITRPDRDRLEAAKVEDALEDQVGTQADRSKRRGIGGFSAHEGGPRHKACRDGWRLEGRPGDVSAFPRGAGSLRAAGPLRSLPGWYETTIFNSAWTVPRAGNSLARAGLAIVPERGISRKTTKSTPKRGLLSFAAGRNRTYDLQVMSLAS